MDGSALGKKFGIGQNLKWNEIRRNAVALFQIITYLTKPENITHPYG
jgi:hypothetical protein